MQRVRERCQMLQAHVYKIENQCGRIETLSRMSSGVLAAQGFLIPLDLVQTQAGQPNDLLLLNIIGSILDSDSRRIGSNPVGATILIMHPWDISRPSAFQAEVGQGSTGRMLQFSMRTWYISSTPICQVGLSGGSTHRSLHFQLYYGK